MGEKSMNSVWNAVVYGLNLAHLDKTGNQFLIIGQGGKAGAIYKDGTLEIKGPLLSANLTYVKQTDTLLGPGFFGNVEYKRLR
jgi:hypothetical protein